MKKVSIITVCFNARETIEQTIRSVITQTYGIENMQYIIIDGSSTDGTQDIIHKYMQHISYYVSEPDNGIYDAMNKGILKAEGDIIGILNADDWYEEDAVKNIVQCFQINSADIVHGEVNHVDNLGNIYFSCQKMDVCELWQWMAIWHPATFVKRNVYERYGLFSSEYKIAADYEFILRCYANKCRFYHTHKVLTNFRETGISSTKHLQCARETCGIALKYIEQAPDKQKVADENAYRLKAAVFKTLYDENPDKLLSYLPETKCREAAVWGTGTWGRRIIQLFCRNGVKISCIIDSDFRKIGQKMEGLEIEAFKTLKKRNVYVVIAIKRKSESIEKRLADVNKNRDEYIFLEEWMDRVASEQQS